MLDEFLGHGSFIPPEHGRSIANEHQSTTNEVRSILHPIHTSKDLEDRMAAEKVILRSEVKEPPIHIRVLSTPDMSMVNTRPFTKCLRLPSHCAGTKQSEEVDPPRSHRRIASDGFKAFAPEHLTRTGHMFRILIARVV